MKRTEKIKKGTVIFDRCLDISYLITEVLDNGYNVLFGNRNRTKTGEESIFCEASFFAPLNTNKRRFGMIN